MIWQFTGVGPQNKGAELMFLAMLEKVRAMDPEGRIAMSPNAAAPYEWRARHGLWQVFDSKQSGRLGWLRDRAFSGGHRESFGMVSQAEVDIVLDASGYGLGDPWKAEWIEGTAAYYERLHAGGTRIVLLPQALGPFENPRVRAASKRILDLADLVFARDAESLDFACDLAADPDRIRQAPDFTNLLKGNLPADWEVDAEHHVAVVPNRQMLAHGNPQSRDDYLPSMVHAMNASRDAGLRPFLLIHEDNDLSIAREIAAAAGMEDAVVHYRDPLELKGILSHCTYSIGSRFHGLINCLSQGVPVIGTSWSHKYRHLFADYSVSDWLAADRAEFETALSRIADESERRKGAETVRSAALPLREKAEQMWTEVETALVS